MTQTTAYTVDAFIDDVRDIFDATQDPLAQASGVAERMELLLKTPAGWKSASNSPTRAATDAMTCTWTRTTAIPAAASG